MPYASALSDRNIKALKNPDDVLSQITKEISDSESVLRDWKNKIEKYYQLYQMVQTKKNYEGLASIFVPETLRAVETITAKIYQIITGQPDWFQFEGRDNNGDEGPALALTHLCRYQMAENGFKSKLMDAIRQMVIAGLCVRKVMWDYQEVTRKRAQDQQMPETVRDTWTLDAVDLLSFHISDINIPYNELQRAAWIGEQYLVRENFIKEKCRLGWFSSEMKDKLEGTPEASTSDASQRRDSANQTSGYSNISKKGKVEIIERWGLCPVEWVLTPEEMRAEGYEEGEQIESVIFIGNRRAILKLERNPFWHNQKPYVACPYIPKEFELPGIGAVQVCETLQEEINDTRNQTMDNKTLILMTMWLKSRGSGIKNGELTVRPNGIITTNDINGLVPLRPPVVAGVGTNMENIAKDDLRSSSGASSNLQGIAQSGVGTATEANTVNRESQGRLIMTGEMFTELVIKPMFVMVEYLNYQHYDHVKVIKIVGPKGVKYRKLEPHEIQGQKDIVIKLAIDASENPAVIRQQLMNFAGMILQLPPQALEFHWKLFDKIYANFFNGNSLSELYPGGPIADEDLLTPEQERDMVLAEQPVVAQRGQDHKLHIQYLESEFQQMQLAVTPIQFELFRKLIMSHYEMLMQEMAERQQQFMMQQAMAQGPDKGNATGHGGDRRNANTSQHTQTSAPSTASLGREQGG